MNKKHGHIHHSRSSRDILSADRVLKVAGLKRCDYFLDAGCGDGFISLKASKIVGDHGKVYAFDVYPESVDIVKKEVRDKKIKNLEACVVDLTDKIPLKSDSIDLCVMANVLHGLVKNDEVKEVIVELSRVIRPEGIFAVVEFKKIEGPPGPPINMRISPEDVADIVKDYNFLVRETSEVGDYHYLVKTVNKKNE